jgi:hypothetical protein
VREGPSRAGTWLHPTTPPVLPPAMADRYIKMQTDFASSQFPDDEGRDGSQNVGLFTIKLFNMADSPRTFYLV